MKYKIYIYQKVFFFLVVFINLELNNFFNLDFVIKKRHY